MKDSRRRPLLTAVGFACTLALAACSSNGTGGADSGSGPQGGGDVAASADIGRTSSIDAPRSAVDGGGGPTSTDTSDGQEPASPDGTGAATDATADAADSTSLDASHALDGDSTAADAGDTTSCPPEPPIGGTCDADGAVCEFGQECCCGECHPSMVCQCDGGQWGCYSTDACLIPSCPDAGSDAGTQVDATDGGSSDAGESDGGSSDVGESDGGSTTACPADIPFGGTCNADGAHCEYGQECCCGSCAPAVVCNCSGGQWGCFYTDYCLIPSCCPAGQAYTEAQGCLECDSLWDTVWSVIDGWLATHSSCKTPADCALAPASNACFGTCDVALRADAKDAFAGFLDQLDADYCTEAPQACGYATPDCAAAAPICDGGTCAVGTMPFACTGTTVPTPEGCLTCNDLLDRTQEIVDEFLVTHDECSVDADCVAADVSTKCSGSCPVAVAAKHAKALQGLVEYLDAYYCASAQPTCPYTSPKCLAPTPVCSAGQCTLYLPDSP